MNWSEFFAMGNYALYVWGSYGATLLVLAYNVLAARRRMLQVQRALQTLTQLDQKESK